MLRTRLRIAPECNSQESECKIHSSASPLGQGKEVHPKWAEAVCFPRRAHSKTHTYDQRSRGASYMIRRLGTLPRSTQQEPKPNNGQAHWRFTSRKRPDSTRHRVQANESTYMYVVSGLNISRQEKGPLGQCITVVSNHPVP